MNPYATINPLLLAKIKKMKSLLHKGQFRGSRGLSLGCGMRIMSLSLPVLCLREETMLDDDSRRYHWVLRCLYQLILQPAEPFPGHDRGIRPPTPKDPSS